MGDRVYGADRPRQLRRGYRALLYWTAEGGRPYMVVANPRGRLCPRNILDDFI